MESRTSRAAKLAADKRPLDEKVRELFLWVFARQPTAKELKAAQEFFAQEEQLARKETSSKQQQLLRQWAYEDFIWALINTKEFMFNH